ncbi:MAG: hypothetical protein H7288_26135 [Kineosporiaceae bacterium]|nr:hypothetical protein [Aeromicrobium sp.]
MRDGSGYFGDEVTTGYSAIREPSESVSAGLVLSDGSVHWPAIAYF